MVNYIVHWLKKSKNDAEPLTHARKMFPFWEFHGRGLFSILIPRPCFK